MRDRVVIALTRDSVCLADDVNAPHGGAVAVFANAHPVEIGRAMLSARYLAGVISGATWHFEAGGMVVILGDRLFRRTVLSVGDTEARAETIRSLHIHYALQEDAKSVRDAIAARRQP